MVICSSQHFLHYIVQNVVGKIIVSTLVLLMGNIFGESLNLNISHTYLAMLDGNIRRDNIAKWSTIHHDIK